MASAAAPDRFLVTYAIAGTEAEARPRALEICLEQVRPRPAGGRFLLGELCSTPSDARIAPPPRATAVC